MTSFMSFREFSGQFVQVNQEDIFEKGKTVNKKDGGLTLNRTVLPSHDNF